MIKIKYKKNNKDKLISKNINENKKFNIKKQNIKKLPNIINTKSFNLNETAITDISECNNLFEGIDLSNYTPEDILNSKKLYNYIVESAEIAKAENKKLSDILDEGLFGALIGATVSATVG